MSCSACHDALSLSISNEHQATTDMFTVFVGEYLHDAHDILQHWLYAILSIKSSSAGAFRTATRTLLFGLSSVGFGSARKPTKRRLNVDLGHVDGCDQLFQLGALQVGTAQVRTL